MTDQPEPVAGVEQVPTFEPVPMEVTEADTIRRQDSDAESWYRNLPYRPRP